MNPYREGPFTAFRRTWRELFARFVFPTAFVMTGTSIGIFGGTVVEHYTTHVVVEKKLDACVAERDLLKRTAYTQASELSAPGAIVVTPGKTCFTGQLRLDNVNINEDKDGTRIYCAVDAGSP